MKPRAGLRRAHGLILGTNSQKIGGLAAGATEAASPPGRRPLLLRSLTLHVHHHQHQQTYKSGSAPILHRRHLSTMGNAYSTNAKVFDGLGLEVPEEYKIPRPTTESTKKLEQLIRANNATFGVLFNNRKFHNHVAHALISAYFLGATPNQLTYHFEAMSSKLTPWKEDSPAVVTDDDWREFLGKPKYERGYFDFFSDKIGDAKFDWQSVVKRYVVDEKLVDGIFGGLTHSMIHLGYASEFDSAYIAAEALTLMSANYLKYDFKLPTATKKTTDLMEILTEIRDDSEIDGVYSAPTKDGATNPLRRMPDKVGYYTARLDIQDPKQTLRDILHGAAMCFLATHKDKSTPIYSFFLLHLLTCSHEVAEVLLNPKYEDMIPEAVHYQIIEQLWATVVVMYISQMRPLIKPERVTSVKIDSVPSAWTTAISLVLNGPSQARVDEHFAKAVRALLFVEQLLQDDSGVYAKGALTFAQEFSRSPHYTGFEATPLLDVKK